ncbi:hypothetical protein [Microbulbifer taiwanensis]
MAHLSMKSPSKNKSVYLTFKREIHFGPMLFNATFEGFKINEELDTITEDLCWSDDEHYLAVVEVSFDSVSKSNISRLKLIDTITGTVSTVDIRSGQIIPKSVSNTGDVKY